MKGNPIDPYIRHHGFITIIHVRHYCFKKDVFSNGTCRSILRVVKTNNSVMGSPYCLFLECNNGSAFGAIYVAPVAQ